MKTKEEIKTAIRFYEHLLNMYKEQEDIIKKSSELSEAERYKRIRVERDITLLRWVIDNKLYYEKNNKY